MQIIENAQFKAEIDEKGAQLTHLYRQDTGYDYIWNNEIWPKHAPVLFPAIGRSNDDSYLYDGKQYDMPQHGFVSDYDFEVTDKQSDLVTLQFKATPETKQIYPFDFVLSVTFSLQATGLHLNFAVANEGQQAMSFALGSHPAFNVPIANDGSFSDYQLAVEPKVAKLTQFDIVKKPYPFRAGTTSAVPNYQDGVIHLDYDMFAKGLIILENPGLTALTLSSPKSTHSIQVSLEDFRYVCLWTKEGADAPFLCIEPFEGLPDVYGDPVAIMTKDGNNVLAANKTKQFDYDITLA
ncbi:MAG: aldose 1-epimerase family protein [Lactobacillus sp.]|jgi:galactose mutarotase-like enzyme|nr:aldose 1-epimerase family protein [Lactobacillus sp.]